MRNEELISAVTLRIFQIKSVKDGLCYDEDVDFSYFDRRILSAHFYLVIKYDFLEN